MESWQNGNASDSKSDEPVNPGEQVRPLYSPFLMNLEQNSRITKTPWNVDLTAFQGVLLFY